MTTIIKVFVGIIIQFSLTQICIIHNLNQYTGVMLFGQEANITRRLRSSSEHVFSWENKHNSFFIFWVFLFHIPSWITQEKTKKLWLIFKPELLIQSDLSKYQS